MARAVETLERERDQLRERLARVVQQMSAPRPPEGATQLVAAESWLRTKLGEIEREIAQGGRDVHSQ